jgi:hypothetical protein
MEIQIDIAQEREDWEQMMAILYASNQHWEQIERVLNDRDHSKLIQERYRDHAYGMTIIRARLERLPSQ